MKLRAQVIKSRLHFQARPIMRRRWHRNQRGVAAKKNLVGTVSMLKIVAHKLSFLKFKYFLQACKE